MQLLTPIPALQNDLPIFENLIEQLPRHPTKRYPSRSLDDITEFIVHHMASEAPLINQAKFHVNGRGWAGLGYGAVIDFNRVIIANPLDWISNHTKGHNPQAYGIAIRGDLSKRSITPMERKLIAGVLASLNAMLPGRKILGHNECVKTACPATSVDQIREDVATLELNVALTDTTNDTNSRLFAAYGRFTDLYNLTKSPGPHRAEAIRKCNAIEQAMVDAGVHRRK